MTTQEIFEQIESVFEEFKTEHSKTTKVSKKNARKLALELKNLMLNYKRTSVVEGKA